MTTRRSGPGRAASAVTDANQDRCIGTTAALGHAPTPLVGVREYVERARHSIGTGRALAFATGADALADELEAIDQRLEGVLEWIARRRRESAA